MCCFQEGELIMPPPGDERVAEWISRKAQSAPNPLAELRSRPRGASSVNGASEAGVNATATVDGVTVARTSRGQMANARVYFPVEDVDEKFFEDCPKRWR